MSVEFERPAPYIDGHGWSDGYHWLLSVYIFGFHLMIGRTSSLWPSRFRCWLSRKHRKVRNGTVEGNRYWYCPSCHTTWPK